MTLMMMMAVCPLSPFDGVEVVLHGDEVVLGDVVNLCEIVHHGEFELHYVIMAQQPQSPLSAEICFQSEKLVDDRHRRRRDRHGLL